MNLKTQLSDISSINLNQIIDDEEFKQLLNQKVQSLGFDSNFLHDLSKQSHHDELSPQTHFEIKKKKPQSYDSEKILREKKIMEEAYERSMKHGKLLSNPIFKLQEKKQNYGLDDEKDDYFTQYMKWKSEADSNRTISKKSNQDRYKQIVESVKFDFPSLEKPNSFKKESSYGVDQFQAEIKKIHQQYLQKVTKATSKELLPQRINLQEVQKKIAINNQSIPDKKSQDNPTPINSSRISVVSNQQSLSSTQKLSNQETKTKAHKFEQSDINEYCFENMIKRKPDFITFKSAKSQSIAFQFQNPPTKIIKKDIQQDYLMQNNLSRLSKHQSSEISSQSSSQLTQKSKIQQSPSINPHNDPYYKQLKQLIQSNQIQQYTKPKKQIDINQIPTNQPPKPAPSVRLNVQRLLKLPYKQFIVFFDQNHRRIVAMTQPEEYKKLQAYQVKCLEHAESIDRLRERFSSDEGARLIGKLSAEQKQKLFKVLYDNQA